MTAFRRAQIRNWKLNPYITVNRWSKLGDIESGEFYREGWSVVAYLPKQRDGSELILLKRENFLIRLWRRLVIWTA